MNIVLFEPDIPGNTGNVARTCVATGSRLHLVGPLGFQITDARLKRAGLDYWPKLQWQRYTDWPGFEATLPPNPSLFFFSKYGRRSYWTASFPSDSYLVFGCETKGLPPWFHDRYQDRMYSIPMAPESVRSLNLSNSVALVVYEALRQNHSPETTRLHDGYPAKTA